MPVQASEYQLEAALVAAAALLQRHRQRSFQRPTSTRLFALGAFKLVHHAVLDEAPHGARFPLAGRTEEEPTGHEAGIIVRVVQLCSRRGLVL
jgi:hypothetical protein